MITPSFIAWILFLLPCPPAEDYKREAGPFAVDSVLQTWKDEKREREVPVKIYFPKGDEGPWPMILFSHGAGGSREGYEYLGKHWASHGYFTVHLQHKGSDEAVWKGKENPLEGIRQCAMDIRNAIDRPMDVSFAIDVMEKLNREDSPFKGKIDMERIGAAGHSFGAYTTLAVAGQVFPLPFGTKHTYRDPRVRAAIPMSAPVPRKKKKHAEAYGSIDIPCLHMTGTLDDSPVGDTSAKERRIPFDMIDGADQYLVTFTDGDHMIFSGRGRLFGRKKEVLFQELIRMGTVAFWDAYLKGSGEAKAWLGEGDFAQALGQDGVLEQKLKPSE